MKRRFELVLANVLAIGCSSPTITNPAPTADEELSGSGGRPAAAAGGTVAAAGGTTTAGGAGAGETGSSGAMGDSGATSVGGDTGEGAGGQRNSAGAGNQGAVDKRPWFTFFTTSQAGLVSFAADCELGLGGDLGGLEGADDICTELAQRSNPGDGKTWRAFLSAARDPNGNRVNAIDRIGQGPWHDFNNRLLAETIDDLLPGPDGRPAGADPQLADVHRRKR